MSGKGRDVFGEVVVGTFMLAVLSLLAYFTIVISGVDLLSSRKKATVRVEFTDIGGLKERDNVVYRGMKVGIVDKVLLAPRAITLQLKVDPDITLRERCRISVVSLSILGGNALTLEEGEGEVMPLEGVTFRGTPPSDWMRDLGEIARRMNEVTADGSIKGIVSGLQSTVEYVRQVSARLERGEGTLGKLLSADDSLYADLRETAAAAKEAVETVRTMAARLERGEGTLGKLLSTNDTAYADLTSAAADARTTFANVARFSEGLAATNSLAARMISDPRLGDDAAALLARLKDAAGNLDAISQRLSRGEGTLGRLAVDATLHDELSALVKDLRQMVDNYRDTTPITSFGSLIGGAL